MSALALDPELLSMIQVINVMIWWSFFF